MTPRRRDPALNTQPRRRACLEVRRTEPTCHLCGHGFPHVDQQRHRLAFTVDELIPRSKGGSATERGNLRAAHRLCNSLRNDRPLTPNVYDECRAAITALITVATPSRNW